MISPGQVNQLVLATVAGNQAGELVEKLTGDGFHVTIIDSSGGILQEATVSLLIGLDKANRTCLLEHLRNCCRAYTHFLPAHVEGPFLQAQPVMIEAELGGATVYAFDIEYFEQL